MHNTEKNNADQLKELEAQQAYFTEFNTWSSVPGIEDVHSLIYLVHQALDNDVPVQSVTAAFPHIHAMMAYHKVMGE